MSFARTKKNKQREEEKIQRSKNELLLHRLFVKEKRFHDSGVRIDKKSRPGTKNLIPHHAFYHRNKNTHYLHNERYAHIIVHFIIVCDERRRHRATTVLFFFFFFSVFVGEDERISKIHHHEQIWKKRKRTPPSVVKRSSQEYEE